MPAVNNLNVQVGQDLNNYNNIQQVTPQSQQVSQVQQLLQQIKTGTIVEGRVLSQNADGSYNIKLDNVRLPELNANATLELMVGERFRAVWDASADTPVLRLSQGELSFLSQVPAKDRELATAMLARGLPLSSEIMTEIKEAWRKGNLGDLSSDLNSMIELWARDVPMTAGNAALISEYAALDAETAALLWDKIRKEIKAKTAQGQDPLSALKELKSGNDETARFLNAHALLMRAPREDINPALLAAPHWPLTRDGLNARVYVGRSVNNDEDINNSDNNKRYWQIGFNLNGYELGYVGGVVESDGRGCNVNLHAESKAACSLLSAHRREIRRELDGIELPVRFIGISRRAVSSDNIQAELMRARGVDVTV